MEIIAKKCKPLLSIITICCNQSSDIEETCESVITQTFQDFEWIVIDGGSTDGTLQKLGKYKNRIDVLISKKDNGRYHAMNKGIRIAKGKYLNFLNGGDSYFEKDTLEKIVSALCYYLKTNANLDVLYGNANFVYENHEITLPAPQKLTKVFFILDNINHQSTFIKKSLFEKYGYYNEQLEIFGDYESWLLFLKNNCVFRALDVTVVNYKANGISSIKSKKLIMEKAGIVRNFFAPQEVDDAYFSRLSILKKIFSITNELDYKVIRILGFKIKYNYLKI
ncbi:MAG: glycosyltransferase [Holosporaceae bacterium]|nr:glycosyltransferase [Holosporaceae bacterium]